ncbi:hypothetical protein MVES1_000233 [Malassezia vespertilionis]|uniref:Uncharacterized protein n=1 Tax=Malassezia vespertilionis TaxID=2020962 RepID=A0A2N1JFK2_9BASI|nr:uncharacterized protein MVES1_000233 [Malassezia vespertilionis]PKI85331.1 hypothetical protein MVES_000222 [Malassezia vespertilionis]WFD04908.1 hypothetical protein MVES1_000233 [Malassezia vespertilionis]
MDPAPTAGQVFRAVVHTDDAGAQYEARVKGRKLQLSNVERAAPLPATPMLQAKVARAKRRAQPTGQRTKKGAPRLDMPKTMAYEDAQRVHVLWVEYVRDLLGLDDVQEAERILASPAQVQQLQNTLLKADWTGARFAIVQSTNPALVHLNGVVLLETHEMFWILPAPKKGRESVQTKLCMVPKRNTVFRVVLPIGNETASLSLDLYGNQMRYTMPARSTRKHKARKTIELG